MGTVMPERIQLRLAKGWRMPPNTVKVDRASPYGNPFVVGVHGTKERCVELFRNLMAGFVDISVDRRCIHEQHRALDAVNRDRQKLAGMNLAC